MPRPASYWPSGKKCRVEKFEEITGESKVSRAFPVEGRERSFAILVRDEVRAPSRRLSLPHDSTMPAPAPPAGLSPGINLLLDVELEVSLRFGCKELPLGRILDSVLETWCRWIATWPTVDLIVGDQDCGARRSGAGHGNLACG